MSGFVIGLMSGTSFDGVDGVVFDSQHKAIIASVYKPYSSQLREACQRLSSSKLLSFKQIAELKHEITRCYISTINELIPKLSIANDIDVIGVHGQTIYHEPNGSHPCTIQLIDAALIAKTFVKPVVSDFRQGDIALGGQGAPLAPLFHQYLFNMNKKMAILNLGGIANISFIDNTNKIRGFDTGPANCLMDAWCKKHFNQPFDLNGQIAAKGTKHVDLLNILLDHSYFKKIPPKSIDREVFSMVWLETVLAKMPSIAKEDVQATLMHLTVESILSALDLFAEIPQELIVCGGGSKNTCLINELRDNLPSVKTTEELDQPASYIEAMMIAWYAKQRWQEVALDLSSITGASQAGILGAIYL